MLSIEKKRRLRVLRYSFPFRESWSSDLGGSALSLSSRLPREALGGLLPVSCNSHQMTRAAPVMSDALIHPHSDQLSLFCIHAWASLLACLPRHFH
jgi:hypothetical protein